MCPRHSKIKFYYQVSQHFFAHCSSGISGSSSSSRICGSSGSSCSLRRSCSLGSSGSLVSFGRSGSSGTSLVV